MAAPMKNKARDKTKVVDKSAGKAPEMAPRDDPAGKARGAGAKTTIDKPNAAQNEKAKAEAEKVAADKGKAVAEKAKEKPKPREERPRRFAAIERFIRDTRAELKKVVWPTRETAINLTVIVAAVSIAVGAFLGIVDFVFKRGFELLFGLG